MRSSWISLAAIACLAGCASPVFVHDGSGDIDLALCAFDADSGGQWGDFFASEMRKLPPPSFKSVRSVLSLDRAEGCDLAVEIRSLGKSVFTPTQATVYSAVSGRNLLALSATGRGQIAKLGGAIIEKFQKGTDGYRQALAERGTGKETAPAPRAPRADIDAPAYRAPERPDDFAVVIGIDGYKDLPNAQFAERDAKAVAAHMRALGVPQRHIVHLSGADASYTALKKYLGSWLPLNVKPQSRVFFYFSGHGAPDIKTGHAYLVPWDGDPSFLKDTAYPLKHLYASLGGLPAREVVVALDTCFSGAGGRSVIPKGTRPLVTKVDAEVSGSKLVVFSASASNEITGIDESQGHGLFTYHFLKGLGGAAKDGRGRVTARSLYDYLRPKVQDGARLQNREQTPTLVTAGDPVLR